MIFYQSLKGLFTNFLFLLCPRKILVRSLSIRFSSNFVGVFLGHQRVEHVLSGSTHSENCKHSALGFGGITTPFWCISPDRSWYAFDGPHIPEPVFGLCWGPYLPSPLHLAVRCWWGFLREVKVFNNNSEKMLPKPRFEPRTSVVQVQCQHVNLVNQPNIG
jgi:hypothetical protein